jgi:hypothetical protein
MGSLEPEWHGLVTQNSQAPPTVKTTSKSAINGWRPRNHFLCAPPSQLSKQHSGWPGHWSGTYSITIVDVLSRGIHYAPSLLGGHRVVRYWARALAMFVLTSVAGCPESPIPPPGGCGGEGLGGGSSSQDPIDRMWSYTGSSSPFRSQCEAWKLSVTCRSVLLHMHSLPVGPYRYKILHRFTSEYNRTPARRERVGWTHVGWGICHTVAQLAGRLPHGSICVPGLGTDGPMVITVHAESKLRLPRQLGRAKHRGRPGKGAS